MCYPGIEGFCTSLDGSILDVFLSHRVLFLFTVDFRLSALGYRPRLSLSFSPHLPPSTYAAERLCCSCCFVTTELSFRCVSHSPLASDTSPDRGTEPYLVQTTLVFFFFKSFLWRVSPPPSSPQAHYPALRPRWMVPPLFRSLGVLIMRHTPSPADGS